MLKKIAVLAVIIFGICTVFYLAGKFNSGFLWFTGFMAVGAFIGYCGRILIGGDAERIKSYFKRRSAIRMKQIDDILKHRQIKVEGLSAEELVALLTISVIREGIEIAHSRASEYPSAMFSPEFFRYMLQIFQDARVIGLGRDFQLRLAGLGENLAKKYQSAEWADEFRMQQELIFKRHKEGIPIIRAPR